MNQSDFHQYVHQASVELEGFLAKRPLERERTLMFLTKFIFSALIDSDRTNTRLFEENKEYEKTYDSQKLFDTYYKRLIDKINSFKQDDEADSLINRLRSDMSEQCDAFAQRPSGIYMLSIPTGGGKTLASLRYALSMQHSRQKAHHICCALHNDY